MRLRLINHTLLVTGLVGWLEYPVLVRYSWLVGSWLVLRSGLGKQSVESYCFGFVRFW